MAVFLLIHGGGHRGWHWNLLRRELAGYGHRSVAPDIPMDNPAVGVSVWADVALEALATDAGEDVIVVGHSYAGLVLPVIGARRHVRRLVFVCANVPVPGRSYSEYMSDPQNADAVIMPPVDYDELGRITLTFRVARRVYYPDVHRNLARAAWARLTPNATTGFNETCPLACWPAVPSSYVLCTEDRIIGRSWAARVAEERLGDAAVQLPGGHSPMLSRPAHLAKVLDELSRR
jgi:pimeloyl-ACP methyl ester carboxylesterase